VSATDNFLKHAVNKLNDLKDRQLFRRSKLIESAQGSRIKIEGKEYLNFSSNDYLGLASHPEIIEAFVAASKKYGLGSGASPLVCGKSTPHELLEQSLADFTGRDAALIFNSGYTANIALATGLCRSRADVVIQDKLCHASIIDGGLLARASLMRYTSTGPSKLVLTDSVFSMDGDIAPLTEIAGLCDAHGALLAVDDAHGFGVLGINGRGTLNKMSLYQDRAPVMLATFGKALGTSGAFISGPKEIIETLRQFARPYIYSTATPPALASATLTSLQVMARDNWRREHLYTLINHFRHGAASIGLKLLDSTTPIQPLVTDSVASALSVSEKLFADGILVVAIRPPTVPANAPRLRITLSASHTIEDVDILLSALKRCLEYE
jgi:8-amino-7-oxononanoate synthase